MDTKRTSTLLLIATLAIFMPHCAVEDALEQAKKGGDNGGEESEEIVSIKVDSGTEDKTTAAASVLGIYYTSAQGGVSANSTMVAVMGVSGPTTMIIFKGNAAGAYECSAATASLGYTDTGGQTYNAFQAVPGTSCTVTVTEYGAVGGKISGIFTAVANKFVGGSPSATTANLSGSFSVLREVDR